MRRLLQSVYAYCEASRESAVSTYCGQRLTEFPAISQDEETLDAATLRLLAPDISMKIPVAENIGEILETIIHECPNIADVWAMSNPSTDLPSLESLTETCAAVSEAFVRHAMKAKAVRWSPQAEEKWKYLEYAHRIIFLVGLLGILGVAFVKNFEGPIEEIAAGVAIFAKPAMDLIRTGRAWDDLDADKAAVRKLIFASLRSGLV
jgi:hypothetical protein